MQYHQLVDNYFFVFNYSHNIEDIEMAFAAFQMKKKSKFLKIKCWDTFFDKWAFDNSFYTKS